MHGVALPTGLQESEQLPDPVFTPSTKAEVGVHDENITFDQAVELVGGDVADRARAISLELYRRGSGWAAARGIIVAETKFEYGVIDREHVVCEEAPTPDSTRIWPAGERQASIPPPTIA